MALMRTYFYIPESVFETTFANPVFDTSWNAFLYDLYPTCLFIAQFSVECCTVVSAGQSWSNCNISLELFISHIGRCYICVVLYSSSYDPLVLWPRIKPNFVYSPQRFSTYIWNSSHTDCTKCSDSLTFCTFYYVVDLFKEGKIMENLWFTNLLEPLFIWQTEILSDLTEQQSLVVVAHAQWGLELSCWHNHKLPKNSLNTSLCFSEFHDELSC